MTHEPGFATDGVAMTAPAQTAETDFEPVYHHYGPHRAGLPPLLPYFHQLWLRRGFAAEMSRATMRSANTGTVLGQLWLVLNPLLLAGVYYLLVTIIRGQHDPGFFTHLTLGLFAFTMVSSAVTSGATSVTGSGKLLINTAFPRLLIPLSAARTAFVRFLPTIPVYFGFHLLLLTRQWGWTMLLGVYFLATMVVFATGLAAFFAALQVYFRDTSSFLPFVMRLWLYLSPVLWLPETIFGHFPRWMLTLIQVNPMYSMIGGYAEVMQELRVPAPYIWVSAAAWALAAALVGFLFFISREREFAVRLT